MLYDECHLKIEGKNTNPMNKVAIVTDSGANLSSAMCAGYPIYQVPFQLVWGNQVYRDGIDIQPADFYSRLQTSKEFPTTSNLRQKHLWKCLNRCSTRVIRFWESSPVQSFPARSTLRFRLVKCCQALSSSLSILAVRQWSWGSMC